MSRIRNLAYKNNFNAKKRIWCCHRKKSRIQIGKIGGSGGISREGKRSCLRPISEFRDSSPYPHHASPQTNRSSHHYFLSVILRSDCPRSDLNGLLFRKAGEPSFSDGSAGNRRARKCGGIFVFSFILNFGKKLAQGLGFCFQLRKIVLK